MTQHEAQECVTQLRALLAELNVKVVTVEADQRKSGRWRVSADLPRGLCIWVVREDAERSPWWRYWQPRRRDWTIEVTDSEGRGQAWGQGATLRAAVAEAVREARGAGMELDAAVAETNKRDEQESPR